MKRECSILSNIFKELSNPKKLGIIILLAEEGEKTVNDICKKGECEQSLISHHLKDLKGKGILRSRKEGKKVFYDLEKIFLLELIKILKNNI